MELMMSVWEPAVAQVHKDVASMQKIVDAEGGNKISPWDYRYYSEKVRKEKYDLDQNVVKVPAIGKPQRRHVLGCW
jgi:peptidyl-dipeptidase Dcp